MSVKARVSRCLICIVCLVCILGLHAAGSLNQDLVTGFVKAMGPLWGTQGEVCFDHEQVNKEDQGQPAL
ncbi:MAG TPA: hypothetical protein DF699_13770, partial [Phycisphaerales bacterium]|nr:hypothetical protein [Phycisphaerales bacterium]